MYHLMMLHYYAIRVLAAFAGFCIAFLIVAIGAEAIIRSLGLGYIRGIIDFSEYGLFLIAILASPWLLNRNQHIRVDLILTQLKPTARQHLEKLINLIMLIIAAIILYYGALVFIESWQRQEIVFREIEIPDWWMQWQIPLAMLLMCIELVQRLFWPNCRYEPQGVAWLEDDDEIEPLASGNTGE